MFILLASLLIFPADSIKLIPDSSYEKIMHWIDTSDAGDDGMQIEIDRYRYGPRLPGDGLDPTYYDSPWDERFSKA